MKVFLAQYKGTSWISKAIRWQTRSPYSHSALMFGVGTVYEAWQKGGVSQVKSLGTNHTPGTIVDLFEFDCAGHAKNEMALFLLAHIGDPYDFSSVLRFATHRPAYKNGKWFCSELVLTALQAGGLISNTSVKPCEVSPRDMGLIAQVAGAKQIDSVITR